MISAALAFEISKITYPAAATAPGRAPFNGSSSCARDYVRPGDDGMVSQ